MLLRLRGVLLSFSPKHVEQKELKKKKKKNIKAGTFSNGHQKLDLLNNENR